MLRYTIDKHRNSSWERNNFVKFYTTTFPKTSRNDSNSVLAATSKASGVMHVFSISKFI